MKILFIPLGIGMMGLGHLIPLLSLASKLRNTEHITAFLLHSQCHELVRDLGFHVLDIDYGYHNQNMLIREILACNKFKPDVVVDDSCWSVFFSAQLTKIPRVSIQRTGIFVAGDDLRVKNLDHGLVNIIPWERLTPFEKMGCLIPEKPADFFEGQMKIVPGIKEIEVLPEHSRNDPSYVFAGSLLMEDFFFQTNSSNRRKLEVEKMYDLSMLEHFFNANKNRFIVYVTFGTVALPTKPTFEAIKYMLDNDTAVITNINIGEIKNTWKELYFFAEYLPMHFVCSNVDLIVHHCGSGTYQYQILHELPSITIPSNSLSRESIALRLEDLGVNCHLIPSNDSEDFLMLFKKSFEKYVNPSSLFYKTAVKKLIALREETEHVMSSFNFEWVLGKAIELFG